MTRRGSFQSTPRRSSPVAIKVALLGVFCFAGLASAERVLKQVHVVSRHGAGSFFDRSVHLTEYGKEQVRGLGLYLRDKYRQHLKDVVNRERYAVSLQSSSSGSAILTAQVLSQVLFDEEGTVVSSSANRTAYRLPSVPVTSTAFENDVYIRAYYDKCQALDEEIDQLADSKEWKDLEKKHERLLQKLGAMSDFGAESGALPLEDLYQAFDAVALAREVCSGSGFGSASALADAGNKTAGNATASGNATTVPGSNITVDPTWCTDQQKKLADALTESQWEELYKLAQQVELDKYDSEKAGRLGGTNLWKTILAELDNLSDADTSNDAPALYVWSGHYETILTMFAAVRMEVPPSGVNRSAAIPSYASAILLEGYVDSDDADAVSVRMLYKDGGAETHHSKTALMDSCDSEGYCDLDKLLDMFTEFSLNDWCDECKNEEADVCMRKELLEAEKEATSGAGDRGSGNQTSSSANTAECPPAMSVGASAGAVAGTFFAGLLIGAAGMGWCCCRRQSKRLASRGPAGAYGPGAYGPGAMPSKSFPPPPPYPHSDADPNLTDLTDVSLDNANYA